MDSHKRSTQLERLEVVETGRRRRWSDGEICGLWPRAFKRRARYRRQPDVMAYHARCWWPGGARSVQSRL